MAGRLEHRRIDTSTGSVAADEDWAAKNTVPSLGNNLAAGEIMPVTVQSSSIMVWLKSYDGMGDSADPVADSAAELKVEVVALHRTRDKWIPTKGSEITIKANERSARIDVPADDYCVVRVKSGTVGPADKALWLFVSRYVTR